MTSMIPAQRNSTICRLGYDGEESPSASASTTFYSPLPSKQSLSPLHSIQSCLDNKRHSESVVTQPPAINSLSSSLPPTLAWRRLTDFFRAVDLMRETKSGGKAASLPVGRPRGIFCWRAWVNFGDHFFQHSSQPEKGLKT